MDRKKQACPYCQESIYANALVCRYCSRDLPPNIPHLEYRSSPPWLPLLLASALLIGGAALLGNNQVRQRLARLHHKKP